ncbi:hypothetical protein KBG31_01900 [Patescibacteria group bacterium]|nr:hypothetical protein [Patescibacteria group bacterium]
MWKKSKKEQNKIEKTAKKFSILTAFLSATSLTIIILFGIYLHAKNWTPIKDFSAKKTEGGTVLNLEFSSKVPVTGYILYGTHPLATNKKNLEGKILERTTIQIDRILPNKTHFVKFVTQTEDGRTFETDFLKVK